MPIEFRCSQCGKLLRTPDNSAGKKGKCPHCSAVMDIPGGGNQSAASGVTADPYAGWGGSSAGGNSDTTDLYGGSPSAYGKPAGGSVNPFSDSAAPNPYSSPAAAGYPPAQYGYSAYGYQPHRGGMILTFGLLGMIFSLPGCMCCYLFFFNLIGVGLSIPALILGHMDLGAIRAGRMDPSGIGQTQAGYVMGIIGVIVSVLAIFGWGALLIVGIAADA